MGQRITNDLPCFLRPPPLTIRNHTAPIPPKSVFLLELYENIFLCLPPAGVEFKVAWPYPPPSGPPHGQAPAFNGAMQDLVVALRKFRVRDSGESRRNGLMRVTGPRGTPVVATRAFYELMGEEHCIWIELGPCFDSADFVAHVLAAIAREVGTTAVPPFPFDRAKLAGGKDASVVQNYLAELRLHAAGRPIVVYVNARHYPGRNLFKDSSSDIHGWAREQLEQFVHVSNLLATEINVVVVCWDDLATWWHSLDNKKGDGAETEGCDEHNVELEGSERYFREPDELAKVLVKQIEAWDHEKVEWYRFILGLTLFRHPCYLSALQCWAMQKAPERFSAWLDNDAERFKKTHDYLRVLRDLEIVRDDEGQSVFMYPALQEEVRKKILEGSGWASTYAEVHQGIADWYIKLYRASGDVHAALESLLHRMKCILGVLGLDPSENEDVRLMRRSLLRSAANEVLLGLDLVHSSVVSSPHVAALIHQFDDAEQIMNKAAAKLQAISSAIASEGGQDFLGMKTRAGFEEELGLARARLRGLKSAYVDLTNADGEESGSAAELGGTGTEGRGPTTPTARCVRYDYPDDDDDKILIKQINGRRYASAQEKAHNILNELGVEVAAERFASHPRESAREWVHRCLGSERKDATRHKLARAIRTLRRFQALKLYQAGLARLLGDSTRTVRDLLIEGEKVYTFATEVMRYVDDVEFVHLENMLLRTNTGILLSWLNRHNEAHRRYSEAYGYLSHVSVPLKAMRYATIDLMRAESFLCRIDQGRPRGEAELARGAEWASRSDVEISEMQQFGLVYDSLAAVDRATYKVADKSARTRWYAWLRELELSVCCEIVHLAERVPGAERCFSRCRDVGTLAEWFCACLINASYVVGSDPYRCARCIKLASDFVQTAGRIGLRSSDSDRTNAKKHLAALDDALDVDRADAVDRQIGIYVRHAKDSAKSMKEADWWSSPE